MCPINLNIHKISTQDRTHARMIAHDCYLRIHSSWVEILVRIHSTLLYLGHGATTKYIERNLAKRVRVSVGARDSTPARVQEGATGREGGEQRIRSFCIRTHAPGVPPADSHASPTARRSRCCSTVGAQLTSRRGSNTCRAGDDATQQKLSVEIAEDSFSW